MKNTKNYCIIIHQQDDISNGKKKYSFQCIQSFLYKISIKGTMEYGMYVCDEQLRQLTNYLEEQVA